MKRPSISPALVYQNPKAALDWLVRAFGFKTEFLMEDETGALAHAELRHGDGLVMVGAQWTDDYKSPASIGLKCTQSVHIHLSENIDAHCERARAAGAEIMAEPATQFYGDRTYRARDPEGHIWTFGETVQPMTPDQWDKASGLKTTLGDTFEP